MATREEFCASLIAGVFRIFLGISPMRAHVLVRRLLLFAFALLVARGDRCWSSLFVRPVAEFQTDSLRCCLVHATERVV